MGDTVQLPVDGHVDQTIACDEIYIMPLKSWDDDDEKYTFSLSLQFMWECNNTAWALCNQRLKFFFPEDTQRGLNSV